MLFYRILFTLKNVCTVLRQVSEDGTSFNWKVYERGAFWSKMVYKRLGFETRGRASRRKLNTLLSSLLHARPLREENRTFTAFLYPLNSIFSIFLPLEEKSSLSPLSCDVVVVGGGISGLYMAETLMRRKKEYDVCLFEKDPRFGGRNYDVAFKQAQNVSLSKKLHFP